MVGEQLDLHSEPDDSSKVRTARPFLGIHFVCCRTYGRIYLQPDGQAYYGHCPRCGRQVRVKTSPDGSPARFFTAY